MSWASSQSLRHDIARARMQGIEMTKGWRRKLKKLAPPTEEEVKAVRAVVVKRDCAVRLGRMIKETPEGHCPFSLHPESEISGELYFRLRSAGLDAKLEVTVPSDAHASGVMRIDIGVFHRGRLAVAIECKQEGKGLGRETQQAKAYRSLREKFGIVLFFANRSSGLDKMTTECVAHVQSLTE